MTATTQAAASGGVSVATGKVMANASKKDTAVIIAIDAHTRDVTLKRSDGSIFNITCGPEVRNFAQLALGDTVTF